MRPDVLERAYCLDQSCCEEVSACTDGGADVDACVACLDAGTPYGDLCASAAACEEANCGSGIGIIEICESGLASSNPAVVSCLEEHCCPEFNSCSNFGESDESIQACIDCLEVGGGPLCEAAVACEAAFCDTAICDSGITYSDFEMAACRGENCCDEYTFCSGGDPEDEEAIDACLLCFDDGGGILCDAAIACTDANCAPPR